MRRCGAVVLAAAVLCGAARGDLSGPSARGPAGYKPPTLRQANEGMDAGRLFGTAGSTWHRPVSPGSRLMRVWEEHQPAGQYSPSHRATIVSWLEFRTPLPGVRDTNGNPGSSDGVVDPGPDGGVDPVDPRPVPTPESVGLAGGGLLLLLSLRRRAG